MVDEQRPTRWWLWVDADHAIAWDQVITVGIDESAPGRWVLHVTTAAGNEEVVTGLTSRWSAHSELMEIGRRIRGS